MKKDNLEVYLGGVFGIVAIIAVIIELNMDGYVTRSVITGIKDVASLGVSFALFLFMVRNLMPKVKFEKRFEKKMNEFIEKNKAIVKRGTPFLYQDREHKPQVLNDVNYNQLFLIKDFKKFFKNPNSILGSDAAQFVLFPTFVKENYSLKNGNGAIIYFCLNKSIYQDKSIKQAIDDINNVINQTKSDKFHARASKENFEIEIECKYQVLSNDEIESVFELIDYVIFLIALGS